MAASVSDGFEKSLRENRDCKFHAPSEYKRCKVSTVRDFPEGCGPFAPRIEAVLKCEDNSQHPELHAKTLVQTTDCSLNKENPVVSSDQVDRPPLVNDEPAKMLLADMEALADTESGRAVKLSSPVGEVAGSSAWTENMLTRSYFPRKKVSAIRDFPALCGRNAPSLLNENRGVENDSNDTRHKVRETLRLFQAVSRKLLQELEAKNERGRVDLLAAKVLKEKGKYVNEGKQILGSVPGIEVGDEFQYRIELNIVGLHRQIQGGIDYVKHSGKILATSIVASGGYADDLDNSDVLIYTGHGGNVMNSDKQPEDQKLERGNLALKNSNDEQNPVRVIRGADSADGRSKKYVYDGLYLVESCWQDMGPHGKLVYKFRLRRISGQPELPLKELKKSK